ncbi:AGAP008633-PA [Anopheles gambiae str. PEST]|uniref:AGAP008633-PA n=1 Tax=Anopheles gambiae TaxID=7165 RepID=Q7Q8H3_ANOGA|nr:AGAP008633-PA [Anopheles gambiae str. PEST]
MDVTLIVKASNQQCEDLTIKCEPSWTIRRLKGHLTEVYPGKPSTDEQKLIYSGQLLGDSVVLKDVLRQYDGQQAHTQANVNAVQSGGALPGTAGNAAPSTTTPTAYPLSGAQPPFPNVPFMPMVQPTTIPGAFPNLAYYPCMATAPYASGFPSSGNIPATAAAAASSPAGTGASNFLPTTPGLPMPSGQQTPTTTPIAAGASAAAGGEAGDGTATAPGTSGGEVVATAAAEQQGAAGGAPQDGGQAGAGAPARARRFPNIVVEEQENNDWLDVFFSMCRVGILITVIYLYSSPIRCLTVLFIGVMLYLKKHLDRYYQADRRTPRVPPVAQDAAPAREQQEPVAGQPNHNNVPEQNAEQLPAHEPAAAAGTSGTESATKRETSEAGAQAASVASDEHGTAEQPAAEGQRMTFNDMTSFLGTLVITFFTSIIPDTPAA